MPSGQSIARLMRAPMLTGDNDEVLRQLRTYSLNLDDSTPLWFYVLREGAVLADGGQLWGRSAGASWARCSSGCWSWTATPISAQRGWRPTLPTRSGRVTGEFRMIDFLTFAGVDPTSRGQ